MANPISPEFLERYQIELQKNPRSRVFAPLSEAYRKMGLTQEALRICRSGVGANPDFSGGLVAYAKVLIETASLQEALSLLRRATTLSPDNLLAHSLMGDALLEMRQPKEALKAFKMVLFLNPEDEKAKSTVKKWEFLTADEFADEEFAMRPLFESQAGTSRSRVKELERALSLADAFTVRNDLAAAHETLERAEKTLGTSTEITNRLAMLARRTQVVAVDATDANRAEASEKSLQDKLLAKNTMVKPKAVSPSVGATRIASHEKPRGNLQARIDQMRKHGAANGPHRPTSRSKVETLKTLLHRISERRLD